MQGNQSKDAPSVPSRPIPNVICRILNNVSKGRNFDYVYSVHHDDRRLLKSVLVFDDDLMHGLGIIDVEAFSLVQSWYKMT